MPTSSLQSTGPDGTALVVEFAWRADRYQHVMTLKQPDGLLLPLLESVEGDAADDWPPSAPLQNLTIEQLPDGRQAALLVGMAGRSHWSASIEALPTRGELVFDLACRHGVNPGQLGSRYRWLIPDAARAAISISAEGSRLTHESAQLTIVPAAESHTAATTRWRFTIRLSTPQTDVHAEKKTFH